MWLRNVEPKPMIVTIILKTPHPHLDFLSAYKVLGENGKTYSVSESFLESLR
jgi:hypothetical protein